MSELITATMAVSIMMLSIYYLIEVFTLSKSKKSFRYIPCEDITYLESYITKPSAIQKP